MKAKKTVRPLILSAFVLLQVTLCHGQSNVVYYGVNSNSISVSFVDTSLSVSAQASIVVDLQVCLNEWGKKTYLSLDLGADEPGLIGYLERPSISPHYPENIEFPEGVTNTPSGPALLIPKALSDAYTNAFAFAAANSNIVAAAYEFVAFVSSSNFVAISSNDLPNYVLQKNTTSNEIIADAQETISELRCQTFYPPAFWAFNTVPRGLPLQIYGCLFLARSLFVIWMRKDGMPFLPSGMTTNGSSASGTVGCRENERRLPSP